jgi:hypothetical protein
MRRLPLERKSASNGLLLWRSKKDGGGLKDPGSLGGGHHSVEKQYLHRRAGSKWRVRARAPACRGIRRHSPTVLGINLGSMPPMQNII